MPRGASKTGAPLPQRGRKQTITFGLVNVPVMLKPAVNPGRPVSGNYICPGHQEKVKMRWHCDAGDHDVDDKVLAYPHGGGFVVLDDDAVEAIIEEKTGELAIERVVPVEEIDPLYYSKTYLVYPGEGGATAFDLLAAALRESGRAAVGNAILGKQTEMVAIRWSNATATLVAHTCAYDSNIRWADVDLIVAAGEARPAPAAAQVKLAGDVLDSLAGGFDPEQVDDLYYPALQEAIEQAAAGKPAAAKAKAEPVAASVDLMDALRQSVQAAKKPAAAEKKRAGKKVAA